MGPPGHVGGQSPREARPLPVSLGIDIISSKSMHALASDQTGLVCCPCLLSPLEVGGELCGAAGFGFFLPFVPEPAVLWWEQRLARSFVSSQLSVGAS